MAIISTDSTYTFTVTGNRSLTAVFEAIVPTYTITATIDPAGSGSVTGAGQYQEGQTVTLVATPADGYKFSGWQEGGQTVSTDTTYSFTATGNRTLVSVFAEKAPSRLPAGYTEVEYIQSASLAGIDTGNKSAPSLLAIYMDVELVSAYSGSPEYILGMKLSRAGQSTNKGYRLSIQRTGANIIQCTPGETKNNKNLTLSATAGRMKVTFNGRVKTFSAGGDAVGSASIGITPLTTGFVDYSPVFGVPDSTLVCANTRFYSMQIYTSVKQRDYVPCVNPSGVVGLYDLAKGVFFGPNFGTFVAGPEV